MYLPSHRKSYVRFIFRDTRAVNLRGPGRPAADYAVHSSTFFHSPSAGQLMDLRRVRIRQHDLSHDGVEITACRDELP